MSSLLKNGAYDLREFWYPSEHKIVADPFKASKLANFYVSQLRSLLPMEVADVVISQDAGESGVVKRLHAGPPPQA